MKHTAFLFCLFIFSLTASAQEKFQWKKLSFESSSVQDAINILGKPKKDKIEKAKFDKSIPANVSGQMNFRKLQYKSIENFEEVYLLFLNEKLTSIEFTPKKKTIAAAELGQIYNSDFLFTGGLPKQIMFADYIGQKETTVPKVYPGVYYMLTAKSDIGIVATINNSTWKALWRDGLKKPTNEMFPGYVDSILVISRGLEKK